jgi:hypothetical protein
VDVDVPVTVTQYNKFRGGVDRTTKALHTLNLFRRDKKWTLRMFRGVLGFSIINCQIIWDRQPGVSHQSIRKFALDLALEL